MGSIDYLPQWAFFDGEALDVEGVLYLIGLQELGQVHRNMKKDDNVNLIHMEFVQFLNPTVIIGLIFLMRKVGPILNYLKSCPRLNLENKVSWWKKHW